MRFMGRWRWQKELWIECWLSLGDDSYNALLSNVYASSGNWSHYIEVKNAMEMKLKKDYVLSSADIIKDIHSSKVEDWSHQRLNRYATGKKKKSRLCSWYKICIAGLGWGGGGCYFIMIAFALWRTSEKTLYYNP